MDVFDLFRLGDADLKACIKRLEGRAYKLSYKRRVLHGQINLLRAGGERELAPIRPDRLVVAVIGEGPWLAERGGDPNEALITLEEKEQRVSRRRRRLHGLIDVLRAEYVARLKKSSGKAALDRVTSSDLAVRLAGKSFPA